MRSFFRVEDVPTNSCIMLETPEEARAYPRGVIDLGFCDACGFIRNTKFDPVRAEYSGRYEETQSFSTTFNRFHEQLVDSLVARRALRNKRIIEIGCGKGEFLSLLCARGKNEGLGFDPGFRPDRFASEPNVKIMQEFFGPATKVDPADFIACKMTLEHIRDVSNFVGAMGQALVDDTPSSMFIQVPESRRIFEKIAFEDIYYEHCSYFTPGSLARLLRRLGFFVDRIELTYDDQYLTVEALNAMEESAPLPTAEETVDTLRDSVEHFATRCAARITEWSERIDALKRAGPVAIWGSGSKAIAFLNAIESAEDITTVVDINPHRHGFFLPGAAVEVAAPRSLVSDPPAAVIVMNRIYLPEVRRDLNRMGLRPELLAL